MNAKRIWLIIPALLMPYIIVTLLVIMIFATDMLDDGRMLYVIAGLFGYTVIAIVLNLVYFFVAIIKKWDVLFLAKTAMVMKLIQIPAYIGIFVLGAAAMITIISMPLAIALAEIDFLMLVMSGSSIIAASITMFRRQEISLWVVCGMVLSQFVFCVDVVMAIAFYVRLKRAGENKYRR